MGKVFHSKHETGYLSNSFTDNWKGEPAPVDHGTKSRIEEEVNK